MKSHQYNFSRRDLAKVVLLPLLPVIVMSVLTHAAAHLDLLPRPRPTLDVDRTILLHQAHAAEQPLPDGRTIFIGDSSCLMGVAADQMEGPALNLATLSYVDIASYGSILRQYLERNSNRVERVILLMHPEALRLGERNEYFRSILENYWTRRDACDPRGSTLLCRIGVNVARARLAYWLPEPLPGAYGRFYGFSAVLWDYMEAHAGSAIDPRMFDPAEARGNPDYRLSQSLRASCEQFRRSIPPGIKLYAGLTPSPQSYILSGHQERCEEILATFAQWTGADQALTTLPFALADDLFASTTHLNEQGRTEYLKHLRAALEVN